MSRSVIAPSGANMRDLSAAGRQARPQECWEQRPHWAGLEPVLTAAHPFPTTA